MDRLNDFIVIDRNDISAIFSSFDTAISVLDYALIKDSMSNTGYIVTTTSGKYFLKLYSNTTDEIEAAAYKYFIGKANVPRIYCYDNSRQLFPFSYAVMEYIDGVTLIQYLRKNLKYPPEIAYESGRLCAAIHQKKYECYALLDHNLNICEKLPSTREMIFQLLDNVRTKYLKPSTVEKLCEFIQKHPEPFDRIEDEISLCHGDFGYNNIMLCGDKMYVIDFEFTYSGSIYNDIGRFFRRKDSDVESLIDVNIYNAFASGYNDVSLAPLPPDWLKLARLCDIKSMLCFLTYDNVLEKCVEDIEYDILCAIKRA